MVKGMIDPGVVDVFDVKFDPNDASGNTAYATMWHGSNVPGDSSKMVLAELDVANASASRIVVGKEPEAMAFLNARYMVVSNGFSDTLSIIDRPAKMVAAEVPLLMSGEHGVEPTALAFDVTKNRLYATLASANAVAAFDVDLTMTPPAITPAGTFPTSWWPTTVTVDPADGGVYVTTGRGHGTGSQGKPFTLTDHTPSFIPIGTVAAVPYMDATALGTSTTTQATLTNVGAMNGVSTVQCNGAAYDFPIPQAVSDGPSTKIKHVVFVVRENKTFDGLMADMPGVEGDMSYLYSAANMDTIWPNTRGIAKSFAHMDNFYEDADQSIQGHYWTAYGRTSDYDERRWLVTWGRGEFSKPEAPGVFDDSAPLEGSILTSLESQGVTVRNMGELLGGFSDFRDTQWPGGSSDTTIPDSPAACYFAAHARVLCDLKQFTYVWIGNDHTQGMSAGKPNPAVMIAENDEATGMILDGLSHSALWPESLVVVVEDDPSDGSDHVDQHRTIALFASPWINRKYVSHGHYDMASIHKLFTHIFGKPYRNQAIANAALPYDLFTSTPDYTPYNYIPRKYTDISCNPGGTGGALQAERWDFSEPDNQPGLDEQVREYLHDLPAK
jgi:DNA-binding beta-propeller fold protein YncE